MLEFHNVEVSGLETSIIACRYAMMTEMPDLSNEETRRDLFEKGLERAKKLVLANDNDEGIHCHANFRTGIRVEFDMKYTQYITKQIQRYHWFDYVSSSSMMHKITKMDFSKCCTKYVSKNAIDEVTKWKDLYNHIVENKIESYTFDNGVNTFTTDNFADTKYVAMMLIISNCPMGAELFVHVNTNYEQLCTMYHQRVHHKLREDWGAFCDMVKSLPYAEDLILARKEKK